MTTIRNFEDIKWNTDLDISTEWLEVTEKMMYNWCHAEADIAFEQADKYILAAHAMSSVDDYQKVSDLTLRAQRLTTAAYTWRFIASNFMKMLVVGWNQWAQYLTFHITATHFKSNESLAISDGVTDVLHRLKEASYHAGLDDVRTYMQNNTLPIAGKAIEPMWGKEQELTGHYWNIWGGDIWSVSAVIKEDGTGYISSCLTTQRQTMEKIILPSLLSVVKPGDTMAYWLEK